MKRIIIVSLTFIFIILGISSLYLYKITRNTEEGKGRNTVVALNEVEQLVLKEKDKMQESSLEGIQSKINALQSDILKEGQDSLINETKGLVMLLTLTCISFIIIVFGYLYKGILRPFYKMEKYATQIAKGDFETTLNYERSNYFGAFTWAFDHMRREIVKARACEKEAIENNKTVIASLSHDIKTPIASIRAYAEGLEENLYVDEEGRNRYISVIIRKCDEVTKLTNDIFLHSLSDLDKLKMNFQRVNIKEFLEDWVRDINQSGTELEVKGSILEETLKIDINRMNQVLENIINNSKKYGAPKIELSCRSLKDSYEIVIFDHGAGIDDVDMPFVLQKFYRGSNVKHKDGAGLGLYIVSYVMKQHNGQLALKNTKEGFEVTLILPLERKIASDYS